MTAVPQESRHAAIKLPDGPWWDWDVVAWNGGEFRLGAGHDITYYHGLELVFSDPLFVICPTAFQDPVFRTPTPDETLMITRRVGEEPPVLVAFEADAHGPEPSSCLIAAEGFDVVEGIVARHWREDLAPGQRFAPWVRPPSSC